MSELDGGTTATQAPGGGEVGGEEERRGSFMVIGIVGEVIWVRRLVLLGTVECNEEVGSTSA